MKNGSNIPIHKQVKKHEMVFEYIMLGILAVLFAFLVIYIFNWFPTFTSSINLPTVAGAVIALYALVWQIHTAIKNKKVLVSLGLDVKVTGHDVIVTASITNDGTKSINPLMTNLYFMEGIPKEENGIELIEFPHVTDHDLTRGGGECFDCRVRMKCKEEEKLLEQGGVKVEFPTTIDAEFNNTLKIAYNLRLLSFYSLLHIMPKESFTEEAIFNIHKPGYYRLFMIYTDKKWKDCICRSAVIHIEKDNVSDANS